MNPEDIAIRKLNSDQMLDEVKPLIGKVATYVAVDGATLLILFVEERTALQITRLPQEAFHGTALVVKVGRWKPDVDLNDMIPALDLIDPVCGRTFTGMERALVCFGDLALEVRTDFVQLLQRRKSN